MAKFKRGEKVLISKTFSSDPDKLELEVEIWQPEMDELIGMIGRIREHESYKNITIYRVETEKESGMKDWWYYPESTLKLHIEDPMIRINIINKIKERNKKNEK